MWETELNIGDLDCSKTLRLQVICENPCQHLEVSGDAFVPISSMCDSSVESEIISFEAGLRMVGPPALQILECFLETLTAFWKH